MICPHCNNAVYLGSRLPEDAYRQIGTDDKGQNIYEHLQCPPCLHTNRCERCWEDFLTHDESDRFCSHYCSIRKDEEDE